MNDIDTMIRQLRARGYKAEKSGGHWQIRWQGRLIASTGSTPRNGKRSLQNFRSRIKRFERQQEASHGV